MAIHAKRLRALEATLALAGAAAATGCASIYDLEPDLKASVGVYVGEFNGALWATRTLISDDGATRTMVYGLGEGCRFVLEMDSQKFVVMSWRYTSEEAAASYRAQPRSVFV